MFIGFVLAQIICASEYNCTTKVIDTEVYASRSDCERKKQFQSVYYSDLACVEVQRPFQ